MQELEFIGRVHSNTGKFHKEMVIPGRESLSSAPIDWPDCLTPGTLNVGIDEDGFPLAFDQIGDSAGMNRFDEGQFKPAFVIASEEIAGNTLKPKAGHPRKGDAQVWRADLLNSSNGKKIRCWMLRRIGSGISSQIELVAEVNLRRELDLYDGTPVEVIIYRA